MTSIRGYIAISLLFLLYILSIEAQNDTAPRETPAALHRNQTMLSSSVISTLFWIISRQLQKLKWEEILSKLDKKGLSKECADDMTVLEQQLMNATKYPSKAMKSDKTILKMMDSTAKIPPGVLHGRIVWTGLTRECLTIDDIIQQRQRTLQGSYCRIHFKIPSVGCPDNVQEQVYTKPMIGFDICVPTSCRFEVQNIVHHTLPGTEICNIRCMEEETRLTGVSYLVLGIIGFFLILALFATVVDYYILKQNPQNVVLKNYWMQCALCFSLYTNVKEIFDTRTKPGQITMLNGVRAFTIAWVIAGHLLLIYLLMSDNPLIVQNVIYDFDMMWLVNAYFSVDTFFYISGFLTGFLFFKYVKNNKRYAFSPGRWLMYYIHRILRLSPAYYIVIAFHTWVTPELLRKSVLAYTFNPLDSCKETWWKNFLYISNYDNLDNNCYISSWYLSTDFQIFACAPIVLIVFSCSKMGGYIFSAFLLLASFIIHVVTIMIYHFPPSDAPAPNIPKDPEMTVPFSKYTLLIYDAPWIRFPPYLIGIMLGYFMQTTPRLKIKRGVNVALFTLSGLIMFGLIHCLYHYFKGNLIPLVPRAFYSALSKPLWASCLAYITYACYHGYGGIINKFLSLPFFIPLGRLSYSIYLLHMSVLFIMGGLLGQRYYLSSYAQMLINHFIPAFVFTTIAAIFLCAIFEIGTGKLEAKLLGQETRRTTAVADGDKNKKF